MKTWPVWKYEQTNIFHAFTVQREKSFSLYLDITSSVYDIYTKHVKMVYF